MKKILYATALGVVGIEDGKVAWYALYNRNWLVETNPHLP